MTRPDHQLRDNLAAVRERIGAACAAAGRHPREVTLVAVTKTWPAADVRRLAELGVADVGENRDQEARAKHAECADLALTWHFVGHLQRNKCGSVAGYADVVHSVDRLELVDALSRAAVAAGRQLTGLVQVSLEDGPAAGRSGAAPAAVGDLAAALEAAPALTLGGVMAVAPLGADPEPAFARLAEVAAEIRAVHPAATVVSAGMTGDLEAAVRHGATHVRIGTALLGHRAASIG
ncbi:MAG: dependent protein [Frankiaceae bacterium]|jgi:pyridoxal phosphate enzyme (YggS family)|nr:dependent protein [Frankiaceae bacterium]